MRVHRNLHNAKAGGPQWVHTVKGKVHEYLEDVVLVSVTTRIQPAGARKAQATGVRNVCAYFDGTRSTLLNGAKPAEGRSYPHDVAHTQAGCWERIAYDPRKDEAFKVSVRRTRWNTADAVTLNADGTAWVLGARWQS